MPLADMSPKSVLGLWLSVLLLQAGAAGEEQLNGVVGESVTFQVKTAPPLRRISWSKSGSGKSSNIAVVTFGEPCDLLIPLPAFERRVNVSEDCRGLQLSHLEQEDTGRYTAEVVLPTAATKPVDEFFNLRVSKRLLGSQLIVTCVPDGGGNGTWQLNCSTGTWEDGVKFSWTSAAQSEGPTLGNSLISLTSEDLDQNATCTAENLVSQASRTVSLKQVCTEARPVTESPPEDGKGPPASGLIPGLIVAGLLVAVAVAVLCVLKRRAGRRSQVGFARGSETDDPTKTGSNLIGDVPKESRGEKAQPPRKAAKKSQEMPHTIYTAVQHPKQDPSQTDDEKMRRKKQRSISNQGEKTIYSEISKSQESEDQHIRTIYETVKNPAPVKPSDFRAFV